MLHTFPDQLVIWIAYELLSQPSNQAKSLVMLPEVYCQCAWQTVNRELHLVFNHPETIHVCVLIPSG